MPNNVKYSPFAVRLPAELRQKLERRAKEESRSLSNLIVKILQEWIENN